jgi:acyl-CoA reductase-like NAD-dependent aldehyde dehydrogenase
VISRRVLENNDANQISDFPAMVPLWCIPIATITGNTMILKPSERDPGAAMILMELIQKVLSRKSLTPHLHAS